MKKLRSATEAEAPKAAFNCVVSAVRRDSNSPIRALSKKLASRTGEMFEDGAAQIGDDALAQRIDEVITAARSQREHADDNRSSRQNSC